MVLTEQLFEQLAIESAASTEIDVPGAGGVAQGAVPPRDHARGGAGEASLDLPARRAAGKALVDALRGAGRSRRSSSRPSSRSIPIEVSPLARKNDADPRFTDRFELFIVRRGVRQRVLRAQRSDRSARALRSAGAAPRRAATKRRWTTTRTSAARSSTACRRRRARASASIAWSCCLTNQPSIRDVIFFPQMRPDEPLNADGPAAHRLALLRSSANGGRWTVSFRRWCWRGCSRPIGSRCCRGWPARTPRAGCDFRARVPLQVVPRHRGSWPHGAASPSCFSSCSCCWSGGSRSSRRFDITGLFLGIGGDGDRAQRHVGLRE